MKTDPFLICKYSFPITDMKEERKKRPRTAFTTSQVKALESEFERNKYLSVAKRSQLARNLKLTETQVILLIFLRKRNIHS